MLFETGLKYNFEVVKIQQIRLKMVWKTEIRQEARTNIKNSNKSEKFS